jgi:hypothetical protein
MMARVFMITVDNDDYHQGQPFDVEDVKAALQGYGCSAECETRAFQVPRIQEMPGE